MRILVVDDNPQLVAAIKRGLEEHGYAVDAAHTGRAATDKTATETYDAIVLDRMLPDEDGLDLCKRLRLRGVTAPIALLTGVTATEQRVAGLDAGADDYIIKPFDIEELVARLRALWRRGTAHQSSLLRFADLELDLETRTAKRGARKTKLSRREFALLEYLVRNADRVLTRPQIANHVWGERHGPESNLIDVYIGTLRRELHSAGTPLIHTLPGVGYILSQEARGSGRRDGSA